MAGFYLEITRFSKEKVAKKIAMSAKLLQKIPVFVNGLEKSC